MNKKTITIIAVLVVTLLLFAGYKTFLSPEIVEGDKEITIHIINEKENVDETFTYNTDHEFLLELLEENQEQLGITFEQYDLGVMITGMMDYQADPNSEYFHTYVNEEDAMTGPGDIPLNDQDVYTFELKNY
ncbi:hypothetical protein K8M07_11515 [Schnuerera sp. xch1]|uniref:hypothetical protein n=1 Tax=Schnuerera sp. xch1 TaxID=2874283 RepID=UPI001CBF211E|nr:hypothetical protein [Schnuerera sp. xch1]MBZ2175864.1 hypothetical protein [Schnuerera sp. xch1]